MIEIFVATLLMMPFDGGGSEFTRTASSRFNHGALDFPVRKEHSRATFALQDKPERPEMPTCESQSSACREQWDEYEDQWREYERKMDAYCAGPGRYRLACEFRF